MEAYTISERKYKRKPHCCTQQQWICCVRLMVDEWCGSCRDLSVDERPAYGQREGGDVLQPVLAVGAALRCRAAPSPGHETHDGRHSRRATQQAQPWAARQWRRLGVRWRRPSLARSWRWRRRSSSLDHSNFAVVVFSALRPSARLHPRQSAWNLL